MLTVRCQLHSNIESTNSKANTCNHVHFRDVRSYDFAPGLCSGSGGERGHGCG